MMKQEQNTRHEALSKSSKSCRSLSPLDPPDLSSLSEERRLRYEAVRDAIRHAWRGYETHVLDMGGDDKDSGTSTTGSNGETFPQLRSRIRKRRIRRSDIIPEDDLSPLSSKGHSWLHHAATLHDSLDTLYLAHLTTEYQTALSILTATFNMQTTSLRPTKTFEYSLRVIGGLLGAFSVSGDVRLLELARDATDSLLDGPFASSPTVLPRMYDVFTPTTNDDKNKNTRQYQDGIRSKFWIPWYKSYAFLYRWGRDSFTQEHHVNSLAGLGSFGVEFHFLSHITGDVKYGQIADDILSHVIMHHSLLHHTREDDALSDRHNTRDVPMLWDVMTGLPRTNHGSLGSGSDSFYEYLLKVPLLNGCYDHDENSVDNDEINHGSKVRRCSKSDTEALRLYESVVRYSLRTNHIVTRRIDRSEAEEKGSLPPSLPLHFRDKSDGATIHSASTTTINITYPVDGEYFQHLHCFVPGMLALGSVQLRRKDKRYNNDNNDLTLARELLEGCRDTYERTPTGLGPEKVRMAARQQQQRQSLPHADNNDQSYYQITNPSYQLRPEYVESLFILYRITREEKYQTAAWHVFRKLEQYCKVPGGAAGAVGGYAGLRNVNDPTQTKRMDDMPSYFLAETLKYLLLIFAPDDYVSLDDFVFTTEAHPIRRVNKDGDDNDYRNGDVVWCTDIGWLRPSVPIPWPLVWVVLLVFTALLVVMYCIRYCFVRKVSKRNKHKRQ